MEPIKITKEELVIIASHSKNNLLDSAVKNSFSEEKMKTIIEKKKNNLMETLVQKGLIENKVVFKPTHSLNTVLDILGKSSSVIAKLKMRSEKDIEVLGYFETSKDQILCTTLNKNEYIFHSSSRKELKQILSTYLDMTEKVEVTSPYKLEIVDGKFNKLVKNYKSKKVETIQNLSEKLKLSMNVVTAMLEAYTKIEEFQKYFLQSPGKRMDIFNIVKSNEGYYLFTDKEEFLKHKIVIIYGTQDDIIDWINI